MNLSDLSIKNPVFAVMLSAAMIVFGWLGYRDMGVSQFPEIDFPVIAKVNPNNLPVLWLTLSGPVPLQKISDFAEKEFKQQIAAIADVGGVQFGGLQSRNIRIWF